MKRLTALGLSLALALWGLVPQAHAENTVGPSNQIICSSVASVSPASATTTAVVSGVAGKSIYICGWHVTSTQSSSTTFQFEYGTQGGPCTTPTTITPAFSVTSTAPSSDHISIATLTAPVGTQLCVVTTGATVGQAIIVYYSQF